MPRNIVAEAVKAEFRLMYFVHGHSTAYNYKIMRYMFVHKSEAASAVGVTVQVRSLEDPETDQLMFPLFSVNIPNDDRTIFI